MLQLLLLVGLVRLLAWVAVRSWARPERFDSSWRWTRPAPCREICPIGPQPYRPRANTGQGATEDLSFMGENAAADARRLPLDDVDEWLAERLAAYGHALRDIEMRFGSAFDVELAAFQRGSLALGAYRSMILDSTGDYGPREHMQLEELLAAA